MSLKTFCSIYIFLIFVTTHVSAQQSFDFYISNKGNDTLAGTDQHFPRETLSGAEPMLSKYFTLNGSVKVGLRSGDIFNENLITSHPVEIGAYADSAGLFPFAILNGSKDFNDGWKRDGTMQYTFFQEISYTGFAGYGINGIGSYSYIYVTEIDKQLEAGAPFSARKVLAFVTNNGDAEKTPGSFFTPINTTENPRLVYVHPSNGESPNSNSRYRYEVTVKDWAVNGTYQAGNVFENLWIRGFGAGIGMLPGGANSRYNKIIFGPGAGIHHLVLRGGTITNSLFLPGAKNTGDFAVVFYDTEGLARHCSIKNSIFLDIGKPVYAHTSQGTNFGAVELENIVAFGDITAPMGFMFTSNTDSVILRNVYTDRYTSGYNYGTAKYAAILNSYFKDVRFGIGYSNKNAVTATIDNVFIKTTGTTYTAGFYLQDNTQVSLTNSIIHLSNSYASYFANAGSFIYGSAAATGKVVASGNIFIGDIISQGTVIAATTNTDNGVATSPDRWDNNVYVLLKGNRIVWKVTNPATNNGNTLIESFDEWKRQSGQDKNSLFFDLRNDPRGLKAIFTDPEQGNYELANTKEGNLIAALKAGMSTPLTCFLKKPGYEEAAKIISENKILSVNSCRNPCEQNSARVNNSFHIDALNTHEAKLEWEVSEQQNIARYEIQRATGNFNFKKIHSLPVTSDSVHSFIDQVQPGTKYQYRLVIYPKAGGVCYSAAKEFKTNVDKILTVYPNPANGKVWISMNGYIGNVKMTIVNSTGQVILSRDAISLYSPILLDIHSVPKGVYFLRAEMNDGISIQKLVLR